MSEHHYPNRSAGADDAMRYERASMRYLDAYDRDDFDAIAQLWREAETDATLEQLLRELNEGLLHEGGFTVADPSRETVLGLLRQTMPSAFAAADDSAITVADVAAAITADRVTFVRLSSADQEVNLKLLSVRTPLPAKLNGTAVIALTRELTVAASHHYWRAFQQAALLLRMSRAGAGRAAARQVKPPRLLRERGDKGKQ